MNTVTVRPIRSREDYEAALARIGELWGARAGSPEADEFDVLWTLAKAWENENDAPPPGDPRENLKFWMDQKGLKPADLVPYLGDRARVSDVLSGKRSLSLAIIRRLRKGLGISADSLIGEA